MRLSASHLTPTSTLCMGSLKEGEGFCTLQNNLENTGNRINRQVVLVLLCVWGVHVMYLLACVYACVHASVCDICLCMHMYMCVCSCFCILCTLERPTIVSDVNQLTYYWLNVECIPTTHHRCVNTIWCTVYNWWSDTVWIPFLRSHFEAT